MNPMIFRTAQLGELVVAAFDEASERSSDPAEVARLATRSILRMLRHARRQEQRPEGRGEARVDA